MKIKTPTLPLRKLCFIEIFRDGKYVGNGIFIRHAGTNQEGQRQSRIINEREMIDFIPTEHIKRVAGEA